MAIIFLNGCTSSGKTSVARFLQEKLPEPHLLIGIDDAFGMLPVRFHNHPDGFYFDRDERDEVRLNFGDVGRATLEAYHRAVAAMARHGRSLIIDEVLFDPAMHADWLDVLAMFDVCFVGLHCSLSELERRELARGDRISGQARGQFDIVHRGMTYDFEVDTTRTSPDATAEIIVEYLNSRHGDE